MAVKTQGTSLFFINPNTNFVVKVGAVSTISGISASRDQIETTDLESNARTYEAGLAAPGTASFGICRRASKTIQRCALNFTQAL